MTRRKVDLNGRTVEGEELDFEFVSNGYVVIKLSDGASLKIRPVIVNVIKTDEKTPEGETLYVVQNLSHVSIENPADPEPKKEG